MVLYFLILSLRITLHCPLKFLILSYSLYHEKLTSLIILLGKMTVNYPQLNKMSKFCIRQSHFLE